MYHKSNKIHPSVIIIGDVKVGQNNIIEPNVILSGNITIGNGNLIGDNCVFKNQVNIGDNNKFIGNCSIGTPGEMGSKGDVVDKDSSVLIGNNNTFREYITINFPVRRDRTIIGNNCYCMARTHIAHDCILKDNVVMATNSLIGGGTIVNKYAYIGLASITHQWVDIGESAMIGLQAANTKHILPFCIVTGIPSRILKFNRVGAERRGYSSDILNEIDNNFREIINGDYSTDNPIIKVINEFKDKYDKFLTNFLK